MSSPTEQRRRFQLVLIKPSHYDDDGYVVQWLRSSIPSNSLAVRVRPVRRCRRHAKCWAAMSAIDITVIDETNTRVQINEIIALLRRHGGFGMVGLVGRAVEPVPARARHRAPAARRRHPGGDRRIPRLRLPCHAAGDAGRPQGGARHGVSLFAGEAEGRIDAVLRDAAAGALRAGLQLSRRPAGAGGHADTVSCRARPSAAL